MLSIREGNVYMIICIINPDIRYVGSTFNQVRHRWQQHKQDFKRDSRNCSIYEYFEKYGIENFNIQLIKKYQVYSEHRKDNKHLRVYEQLWINKLKCVNQQNALTFDFMERIQKKQYLKQYYEQNKNKIKIYYEKNKHKIKQQSKQYREQNKDKINQQNKQYREEKGKVKVVCAFCGSEVQKVSLTRHKKTKKCQSFHQKE